MNEEMEKCVLQNIPWANLPATIKQVIYIKNKYDKVLINIGNNVMWQ